MRHQHTETPQGMLHAAGATADKAAASTGALPAEHTHKDKSGNTQKRRERSQASAHK